MNVHLLPPRAQQVLQYASESTRGVPIGIRELLASFEVLCTHELRGGPRLACESLQSLGIMRGGEPAPDAWRTVRMPIPEIPVDAVTESVIAAAERIAADCGRTYVGTEHITLALLARDHLGAAAVHDGSTRQQAYDRLLAKEQGLGKAIG